MKLSSKSKYAIQAMLKLSLNYKSEQLTLKEIASHQGISLSYLEQLFFKLRRFELVRGVRGPGGGYRLGKSPSEISVSDIVLAVEESTNEVKSGYGAKNKINEDCITNKSWDFLQNELMDYLDSITLGDLIGNNVIEKKQSYLIQDSRKISTIFPIGKNIRAA